MASRVALADYELASIGKQLAQHEKREKRTSTATALQKLYSILHAHDLVSPIVGASFTIPSLSAEHMCWGHPCANLTEQGWQSTGRSTIPGKNAVVPTYQHPDHGTLWVGGKNIYHALDGVTIPTKISNDKADDYIKGLGSKPVSAPAPAPAVQETPKVATPQKQDSKAVALPTQAPDTDLAKYKTVDPNGKVAGIENLSSQEKVALSAFKNHVNDDINAVLLGVTPASWGGRSSEQRVATGKMFASDIVSAFDKLTTTTDMKVYRGLPNLTQTGNTHASAEFAQALLHSAPGTKIDIQNPQSASADKQIARSYANKGVMLEIYAPKGTHGVDLDRFGDKNDSAPLRDKDKGIYVPHKSGTGEKLQELTIGPKQRYEVISTSITGTQKNQTWSDGGHKEFSTGVVRLRVVPA